MIPWNHFSRQLLYKSCSGAFLVCTVFFQIVIFTSWSLFKKYFEVFLSFTSSTPSFVIFKSTASLKCYSVVYMYIRIYSQTQPTHRYVFWDTDSVHLVVAALSCIHLGYNLKLSQSFPLNKIHVFMHFYPALFPFSVVLYKQI